MKLSPNHLSRYKQIAPLFWNCGRFDVVQQLTVENGLDSEKPQPSE
jgi:hypothetical protein